MKFFSLYIALLLYFFQRSNGNSIVADSGKELSFLCFNTQLTNSSPDFYLDLWFKSAVPGSTNVKIASYKPSRVDADTIYKVNQYEDRLSFNTNGMAFLKPAELVDEGTFTCEGNAFDITQSLTMTTVVTVNVAPTLMLTNVISPIQADISLTSVAECSAMGGKPQPVVHWISKRQFKFSEKIRAQNVSSTPGLTNVVATLELAPTRFYNNEIFQCIITHPGFEESKVFEYKANVTYKPTSLQITANKENTQLTCHADGNPPVKYTWTLPAGAIELGPTVSLISPYESSHMNDTYTCKAENSRGTASLNTTTYQATHVVALNDPVNAGVVVGVVLGALALIALVLALVYFFYCKRFRNEDKGPYMKRASLVRQSTDSYSKPIIQHSNDVLNKGRPPSPQLPPPSDDHQFDHSSASSSDEEGNHDVDLNSRVVQPASYSEPPVENEITSRSSMNFRARRQRPTATGSRRSGIEMTKNAEEAVPLSNMHYDMPPQDSYHEEDGDYSQSSGDYRGHNLHHPPYVGYPSSQGYPSRDSPSMHETAYTEIDHRSYTPEDSRRRTPYEEPVEYAQIRKGNSALV